MSQCTIVYNCTFNKCFQQIRGKHDETLRAVPGPADLSSGHCAVLDRVCLETPDSGSPAAGVEAPPSLSVSAARPAGRSDRGVLCYSSHLVLHLQAHASMFNRIYETSHQNQKEEQKGC